ncbi:hypothetical protein L5014_00825 [Paraburkholderia sp. RG36]|uniref:Uncharacterized protein n=1 Tax=Paraburkholderia tagetis TaxID=2913261 RepID=A0A9X1RLT9_9BURK|nr:hypothetical protein [Paraburkholderia tagetis]
MSKLREYRHGNTAGRRAIILPLEDTMFEACAMSVVAVTAGASLTFLCAILMPDAFVKKSVEGGMFAGLGATPMPQRVARARHPRRVRRAGQYTSRT